MFLLFSIFYIWIYIFYKAYLKYKVNKNKNKEIEYIFEQLKFLSPQDKFNLLVKKLWLNSSYLIADYIWIKEYYVIEKINKKEYDDLVFLILNILKNEKK